MPSINDWFKSLWDKDKFEVTLRSGIICICGFSLSVAAIPNAVPPSQALMPGVLASTLSQVIPTLMYSTTLVLPMVLLTIIGVAMLLAAAAVSKGCFLGVYAVYTLLMTALYFGETYTFTSSLANAFISLGGLIGVSSIPLIEQGGLSDHHTTLEDFTENDYSRPVSVHFQASEYSPFGRRR